MGPQIVNAAAPLARNAGDYSIPALIAQVVVSRKVFTVGVQGRRHTRTNADGAYAVRVRRARPRPNPVRLNRYVSRAYGVPAAYHGWGRQRSIVIALQAGRRILNRSGGLPRPGSASHTYEPCCRRHNRQLRKPGTATLLAYGHTSFADAAGGPVATGRSAARRVLPAQPV
jgi:hypothetical protein